MGRTRTGLALAAPLVAAALLHARVLVAPFFADDWLFLDQVRDRPLAAALASPDPIGNFVRPLGRQAWFWLLARAGGGSPAWFHAGNLVLFLVSLVLLAHLARRVAGPLAAAFATGFVALHYAADVPLLWASGSQDLLATTLALAALALHLARRRAAAAALLVAALFAKETVALAPLAAAALDRAPG
ncbi:MAG TPA: hypothetical protein VGU27_04605, partial [Candidatus Eisenbacteria bacterium]|nr:hypothetical protein [Candidatus Eisenbacteria bacterium]